MLDTKKIRGTFESAKIHLVELWSIGGKWKLLLVSAIIILSILFTLIKTPIKKDLGNFALYVKMLALFSIMINAVEFNLKNIKTTKARTDVDTLVRRLETETICLTPNLTSEILNSVNGLKKFIDGSMTPLSEYFLILAIASAVCAALYAAALHVLAVSGLLT